MPMTMLFAGALFALVFVELESELSAGRVVSWRRLMRFRKVRSSTAMLLLVVVTALLAGAEVYMVAQGQLYNQGLAWPSWARFAVLIAGLLLLTFIKYRGTTRRLPKQAVWTMWAGLALVFLLGFYG